MITITLNEIRAHDPCPDGWKKLLKAKGKTTADDERFPLSDILETNDLEDCLWALRCIPRRYDSLQRKFAVWAARQVGDLMEGPRSLDGDARDVAWTAVWAAAPAARAAQFKKLKQILDAGEWIDD